MHHSKRLIGSVFFSLHADKKYYSPRYILQKKPQQTQRRISAIKILQENINNWEW
jgi:hypothetical protein